MESVCYTQVTFNDMLPVLLSHFPLAAVIHKGLHFPEGHWAATYLKEVRELGWANKQGSGPVGLN